MSYEFELPYPPTVNHYYRRARGGQVKLGDAGAVFRRQVMVMAGWRRPPLSGRLSVSVTSTPPDRRRRDIDNILKGLLDSLQHAGIYHDDAQIYELNIRKVDPDGLGGCVVVRVEELEA